MAVLLTIWFLNLHPWNFISTSMETSIYFHLLPAVYVHRLHRGKTSIYFHGDVHALPDFLGVYYCSFHEVAAVSVETTHYFRLHLLLSTSILRRHHLPPALLEVPAWFPDPTGSDHIYLASCSHLIVVQKYTISPPQEAPGVKSPKREP